ncbi:MAG TPA: type II secretion system F family protein [Candidatus Saccharimonadales bacterium]
MERDEEHILAELALLLKAGVPVGKTFMALQDATRSSRTKRTLRRMAQDVDEGTPLWRVLERSRLISSGALALIKLGEKSGNLAENLALAARQEEKQRLFRARVRSALLYPAFVLTVTVVVASGITWYLLPRLAQMFTQMGTNLPWESRLFVSAGHYLSGHGWVIPATVAVLALAVYAMFFAPRTRFTGQAVLFALPGIARMLREIEVARFGYLLGTLLKAGMSVTEALDLLASSTTLRRYQRLYSQLRGAFDEGYGFNASLPKHASSYLLPQSVQQMIIAGEKSGALPETLLHISEVYQQKADVSTQNVETIIEPALLILVWMAVLAVAVAVIVPVYSLVSGLGG